MNIERIRDLCRKRGTNLRQLEISLGFGNGTIARWEEKIPSVTRVKDVADYFGVTIDSLLEEEDHAETAR